MEMMAVIQALNALKEPCMVKLHSDAALIIDAFNKSWIPKWIGKKFKDIKNPDLWKDMIKAAERH
jgi:ribonuclease HI